MEMGLGKRGGLDWIPKICPVKGSTREWRSQALILLFWALLEVKPGFRAIPTKLFEKRPSSSVKTAEM